MGCLIAIVTGLVGLIAYGLVAMLIINLIIFLLGVIGIYLPFVGFGTAIVIMIIIGIVKALFD